MPQSPSLQTLSLANDLRARAKKALAHAETFHDADVRQKLRKIAGTCMKLALQLEHRAYGKEHSAYGKFDA
jgi:hypothetical protein